MNSDEIAKREAVREAVDECGALSPREREVLVLSCMGMRPAAVGAAMGIARASVHVLRWKIMRRLDVQTMEEAAVMAVRAGLV